MLVNLSSSKIYYLDIFWLYKSKKSSTLIIIHNKVMFTSFLDDFILQRVNSVRQGYNKLSKKIANRGRDFIWEKLRIADVFYWRRLIKRCTKLLSYKPTWTRILMKYIKNEKRFTLLWWNVIKTWLSILYISIFTPFIIYAIISICIFSTLKMFEVSRI